MKKPLLLLTPFVLLSFGAAVWYGAARPASPAQPQPDQHSATPSADATEQPNSGAASSGTNGTRPETERRREDTQTTGASKPGDDAQQTSRAKPAPEENAVRTAGPIMYGPDGVPILRVGER
jgi:hypothetical protein